MISHTGDSPKWVKSKRRRTKKERERAKVGNNNGARKAAWAKNLLQCSSLSLLSPTICLHPLLLGVTEELVGDENIKIYNFHCIPRSLSQPCTPSTLNTIYRSSLVDQSVEMDGHNSVEATIYLAVSRSQYSTYLGA